MDYIISQTGKQSFFTAARALNLLFSRGKIYYYININILTVQVPQNMSEIHILNTSTLQLTDLITSFLLEKEVPLSMRKRVRSMAANTDNFRMHTTKDGGRSLSGCCSGTQKVPLALRAYRGCAAQDRASLPQRACSQIIQETQNIWKTKNIKSKTRVPALTVGICTPSCPSPFS